MKVLIPGFLVLIGSGAFAQFKNVKVSDLKDHASSISVAVNEKDPATIVVALPDLSVYSHDAGGTWQESKISSLYGAADAQLLADSKGHIYYFHTSVNEGVGEEGSTKRDRIISQKTIDGGKTWSLDHFAGLSPSKVLGNLAISTHPKKNLMALTWTQFDQYGSEDVNCQSAIFFSKSSNGEKWSKPFQINQNPGTCKNDNTSVLNATSAVDVEGKIFVAWANNEKLYFDRSYDGDMWLTNDLLIGKQVGGSLFAIPGFGLSDNGPILTIDNSLSRYHKSLYMIWADLKNGATDADIWFMRSTNRGDYWTSPARLSKDVPGTTGTHQFMPASTVDQSTGFIYVVYYDRRDHNNTETDVYLSYSFDGGNHFNDVKISEASFTSVEPFHGDTQISAFKGEIVPVWIREDNEGASVWTTVIKETTLKELLSKEKK